MGKLSLKINIFSRQIILNFLIEKPLAAEINTNSIFDNITKI